MRRFAAGFVFVLVAAPAFAQVVPDTPPERFDVADANDDDRVDRSEFVNFIQELVLVFDTDRDGRLARSEVANAPDPAKFDQIDSNRDGFLVIDEVDDFIEGDFAVLDSNGDGSISRAEVARR